MSDRTLTPKQKDKIKKIREKWLEEAEPYLKDEANDRNKMALDGGSTTALAQIQLKYNKQIQEVLEASE
jgi:hypothetical protein